MAPIVQLLVLFLSLTVFNPDIYLYFCKCRKEAKSFSLHVVWVQGWAVELAGCLPCLLCVVNAHFMVEKDTQMLSHPVPWGQVFVCALLPPAFVTP